jgi:hypothetical protein
LALGQLLFCPLPETFGQGGVNLTNYCLVYINNLLSQSLTKFKAIVHTLREGVNRDGITKGNQQAYVWGVIPTILDALEEFLKVQRVKKSRYSNDLS